MTACRNTFRLQRSVFVQAVIQTDAPNGDTRSMKPELYVGPTVPKSIGCV